MDSIAEILFWIIIFACILSLICLYIQDAKSYHESKLKRENEERKEKLQQEKLEREREKNLRQNWWHNFHYLARIERRGANNGDNYEERNQEFEKAKSYIESLGHDYYEYKVWKQKRDYEWDKKYGKYREK